MSLKEYWNKSMKPTNKIKGIKNVMPESPEKEEETDNDKDAAIAKAEGLVSFLEDSEDDELNALTNQAIDLVEAIKATERKRGGTGAR